MKMFEDIASSRHNNYFSGLTGLRGFAATWVMLLHFYALTPNHPKAFTLGEFQLDFSPFISLGWIGVHIFFVLSGFLLSVPFIRWMEGKKAYPKLPNYYAKRILRVFPAYYFQLMIVLILSVTIGYKDLPGWESFLLHLFMLINIEPWFVQPLEGVWWTLPTELSFYLVLPLIAVLAHRLGIVVVLLLSVGLTVAFRYWFFLMFAEQGEGVLVARTERFPGHISLFVIGMMASYLFQKYKPILQRTRVCNYLLLISVVILFCMGHLILTLANEGLYHNGHYMFFFWNSINAIGIAMLILSIAAKHWLCRILFENRFILFLGVISYSIYLWHFLIMTLVKRYIFTDMEVNWPLFMVSFPIVALVSALSYQFIEAPIMRLGGRLFNRS